MLQRIQTIYLALSLLLGILLALFSVGEFQVGVENYEIRTIGIFFVDSDGAIFEEPVTSMSTVLIFHLLLTLATVFKFKDRTLQIRLCSFNILLLLVLSGLVFFLDYAVPARLKVEMVPAINYKWGAVLPFISAILQFLALKAIQKDDKLIRSVDRIR